MMKENLAIIALIVIVVAALSIVLAVTFGDEILNNIFEEEEPTPVIEFGDLATVHYIGRYADNGTVFDTSYQYVDNKTGGTPLKVFVTLNSSLEPPETGYSQFFVEGFIEGLEGLEEGEEATIGPIPPEKAYGARGVQVDDTFYTLGFTASNYGYQLNQTMQVTDVTAESVTLKWIDIEEGTSITLPEAIIMEDLSQASFYSIYETLPPFFLWENGSTIGNVTEENVMITLNPTSTDNIVQELSVFTYDQKYFTVFPDVTTAEWNDTKVTLISTPVNGTVYNLTLEGDTFSFRVTNVSADGYTLIATAEGQEFPFPMNNTLTFNRSYALRRIYTLPTTYSFLIQEALEREGFSLHQLAGKSLLFDVDIIEVVKIGE